MHTIYEITEHRYIVVVAILFILYMHTGDSNDRSYLINNQTQFVAWAYGPRATEEGLRDLAFFHTEYPRNGGIRPYQFQLYKCTIILYSSHTVIYASTFSQCSVELC